jgi:single-stranded-DNA-specific exonuclease
MELIARRGLDDPDSRSVVLAGEGWHPGVIGIVASRIVDRFNRPTVMIGLPQPVADCRSRRVEAQGSARSIKGFDILDAVDSCGHLLLGFGGHAMAAGIRVEPAMVGRFAECFDDYAKRRLGAEDVVPRLEIDAAVCLESVNMAVVSELRMLEPHGPGNPQPVFASRRLRLLSSPRQVGSRGDHLQFAVTDGTGNKRCIGFGMGGLAGRLVGRDCFDMAYQPQINCYNGNTSVELVVSDIQFGPDS